MNTKSELLPERSDKARAVRVSEAEQNEAPVVSRAVTPMDMLQIAVQQGADLDKLERLMALQERYEATQARKAYNDAFARFKSEAVTIIKNRAVTGGPLSGKRYAELFAVVNAVTPALSRNGLSASWTISKDEAEWVEVTCTLRHVDGYSESVSMGGPPDTGGAKNAIQARASTVSYLERYTLKAITGLSEQGDDTDAQKAAEAAAPDGFEAWWKSLESEASKGADALKKAWNAAPKAFRVHVSKAKSVAWEILKADAAQVTA